MLLYQFTYATRGEETIEKNVMLYLFYVIKFDKMYFCGK